MNSNFPEHALRRLIVLLALMLMCERVAAQTPFFECAKNPKACTRLSRPEANARPPASPPAAQSTPGSDAASPLPGPAPALETADTQRQRRLEEDLLTREQQAREARQEADRLRRALEEA